MSDLWKIVVTGDILDRELLLTAGSSRGKDVAICGAKDYYADDLIIDQKTGAFQNCLIYLYKTPSKINDQGVDKTATVYFDHVGCRFEPDVMVIQAGQTVEVSNSDPVAHNTTVIGFAIMSGLLVAANTPKGQGVEIPTAEKERVPIKVRCDYHRHMTTYWPVVEHLYAAATDAKGEFTIKNLPVGEHKFRVWHERCGWVNRDDQVSESKPGKPKVARSESGYPAARQAAVVVLPVGAIGFRAVLGDRLLRPIDCLSFMRLRARVFVCLAS